MRSHANICVAWRMCTHTNKKLASYSGIHKQDIRTPPRDEARRSIFVQVPSCYKILKPTEDEIFLWSYSPKPRAAVQTSGSAGLTAIHGSLTHWRLLHLREDTIGEPPMITSTSRRHIVGLDYDQSLHQQTNMDRLILSLSASRRHQEIEAICINVWPHGQQSQSDSIFQAGRSVNGVQAASNLHSHYQQSTQMEPVSSASSINQHLHPDGNRHSSSENQSRGDDD